MFMLTSPASHLFIVLKVELSKIVLLFKVFLITAVNMIPSINSFYTVNSGKSIIS